MTVDRRDVHARRADEVADESVRRPLEQILRRADLHDLALVHHDDLVGEGERLGLVVRDVDHGQVELAVQLLQLRAQLPLQMRIDDGERLVEEDGGHVRPHEAAAERHLLLGVGGQPARPLVQHRRRGRASWRPRRRASRPRPAARRGCAAERRGYRATVMVS